MARTNIAVQVIDRSGLSPSYAAADGVDQNAFVNNGETFLHVKNGGASPITATFQTPGLVDGLAVADLVVSVPNAEERMIGPFPTAIYNQGVGVVHVDWSSATSVTVAAFRMD